jgi:hypothetical protein
MPFTFSHPATVVPLARKRPLVFSALIIGSMTPDVESFLHLSTDVSFAHTPVGVFLFCLPVGLLLFLLFHHLLKRPFMTILPANHQRRLLTFAQNSRNVHSVRQWAWAILSIVIGAFTHIGWDAFTHEYGWAVQKLPVLQTSLLNMKLYTVLQHGSTFTGALLLGYWYSRWYVSASEQAEKEMQRIPARKKCQIWGIMLFGAGIISTIYALSVSGSPPLTLAWLARFPKHAVLMGIDSFFLEALAFSVYWHIYIKRNRSVKT